jgi:hypothetical protein
LTRVRYRTFTAETDGRLVASVWLDGEDVTEQCAAFCGAANYSLVVPGWVELLEMTKDGHTKAGPDGEPIRSRRNGLVSWERQDDLGIQNLYTVPGE